MEFTFTTGWHFGLGLVAAYYAWSFALTVVGTVFAVLFSGGGH